MNFVPFCNIHGFLLGTNFLIKSISVVIAYFVKDILIKKIFDKVFVITTHTVIRHYYVH